MVESGDHVWDFWRFPLGLERERGKKFRVELLAGLWEEKLDLELCSRCVRGVRRWKRAIMRGSRKLQLDISQEHVCGKEFDSVLKADIKRQDP